MQDSFCVTWQLHVLAAIPVLMLGSDKNHKGDHKQPNQIIEGERAAFAANMSSL